MKSVGIKTLIVIIIVSLCLESTKAFSLREFWGYVPNEDENLSRQKRITVDEPSSKQPAVSAEIFIDPLPEGGGDETAPKDALIEWHGTHVIRTVSSQEVPAKSIKGDSEVNDKREAEASLKGDGTIEEQNGTVPSWPAGKYGIPRSIYGCPDSQGFSWKTGFRFDDTEDDGTENQHSDSFHLAGNFSEDGIRHEFCIKDSSVGSLSWPKGKYCLYKRGPTCPKGLIEGFVIWDDENIDNTNEKGGTLPEGHYTDDTKIYFCCRGDGSVDDPISLPVTKPFYLLAYESIKCQKVKHAKVTSEFIKFDDEDRGNIDYEGGAFPYGVHKAQKDHMLFLCFYEHDPEDFVVHIARNRSATSPGKPMSLKELQQSLASSGSGASDQDDDQEAIKKSEEMIKQFLVATGGEEDKHNKNERAKTIIKTIRVPSKSSHTNPLAVIVGIVLGAVIISTAIILIAKYVISRHVGGKSMPGERMETTWTQSRPIASETDSDDSDDGEEICYRRKFEPRERPTYDDQLFDDACFVDDDEELVEDQLLPESELKNGLELMFLKQQRHYWSQNRRPNRQQSDYSEDNDNETL